MGHHFPKTEYNDFYPPAMSSKKSVIEMFIKYLKIIFDIVYFPKTNG